MLFAEEDGKWQAIPQWADYLIRFGYGWPESDSMTRRVGLISMPCDSPAAGLVALGAMRKRLELDDANDLATHFKKILDLARTGDTETQLFKHKVPYVVDGMYSEGQIWVRQVSRMPTKVISSKVIISAANANDWKLEGEPPVQALHGEQVPYERYYAALVEKSRPLNASNLARSDSRICLAGRVTGEQSTQRILARIQFQVNGCITNLSQLLTVQYWLPGKISRVLFFNTRTSEFDRNAGQSGLVVADGDTAFLRVIDKDEFRKCSIVGIINRTIERDKLELVGSKLADLSQWYVQDEELQNFIGTPLRGISVSILRRR
jgi:hypothetical protein